MGKKNIFLVVEYDGTNFCGWQRQPQVRTAQGLLEEVLSEVCRMPIQVDGVSRTDAGVHALCQCVTFQGDFGIPADRIPAAVNGRLRGRSSAVSRNSDLRVISACQVPDGFHARYDSRGKRYRYRIHCGGYSVFSRNYCWHIMGNPDIEKMRRAAEYIRGRHDFKCFEAAGSNPRETTVRTIWDLEIKEDIKEGSGLDSERDIVIEVSGDGFLYNMVRIIVGTLIEVGLERRTSESVRTAIENRDRSLAGVTAPPQGLCLAEVFYDERRVSVER